MPIYAIYAFAIPYLARTGMRSCASFGMIAPRCCFRRRRMATLSTQAKSVFSGPVLTVWAGIEGVGHHGVCATIAPHCPAWKRGRDGTRYSRFHASNFLSHHLAKIVTAAVYSDAQHIEEGVYGLKTRAHDLAQADRHRRSRRLSAPRPHVPVPRRLRRVC